jgi:5-methyltetrahydrofolate--homocysteine methyltransferase
MMVHLAWIKCRAFVRFLYKGEVKLIIVGEKLNSSIPKTLEALNSRDEAFVLDIAKRQLDGYAQYLDVNAAMCGDEGGTLRWVVETVSANMPCRFMIDSPNPQVIAEVYGSMELGDSIINSVTLEEDRFDALLPVVQQFGTGVVAMPIDAEGMPHDWQSRVRKASRLVEKLAENGVGHDRIYVDIVVEAAGAAWEAPGHAVRAASELRKKYPDIHLLAGLSNVSFGLPGRAAINRAFLCLCMANGVDSAIMDAANAGMVMTAKAADAMQGNDEFCMHYITAFRKLNN